MIYEEPKEMGLSEIANNDSAKHVMKKDKPRELAVVLYEKVKENASIDWTIKESVRAKLKVIVKRILRQYGYPLLFPVRIDTNYSDEKEYQSTSPI